MSDFDASSGEPGLPNKPNVESGPPVEVIAIEPGLVRFVQLAVADLSNRLEIEPEMVTVLSAEFKVWPNAALGCPRPGMQYLQRPVDGCLLRLRVDKKIYRYHAGGSKSPFLCE